MTDTTTQTGALAVIRAFLGNRQLDGRTVTTADCARAQRTINRYIAGRERTVKEARARLQARARLRKQKAR